MAFSPISRVLVVEPGWFRLAVASAARSRLGLLLRGLCRAEETASAARSAGLERGSRRSRRGPAKSGLRAHRGAAGSAHPDEIIVFFLLALVKGFVVVVLLRLSGRPLPLGGLGRGRRQLHGLHVLGEDEARADRPKSSLRRFGGK